MNPASEIALVTFFGVVALALGVFLLRWSRQLRVHEQLRKRLGADERALSLLKTDEEKRSDLARLVAESGLGWTIGVFVTRMVLAGFAGLVVGFFIGGFLFALLLGAAGALVFPFIARQARERRLALCDQQMPQALEIVTLALRAGHPLPRALNIAAMEAPQPIADELRRVCDEHDLGRPIGDALINLGARLPDSEAVHTFMTAVLVLQQTGGNLIAVIDRIVENARARSQYRAKLRALTAEGRASARMLAIMPLVFAVLAAMVDPTYTDTLFHTGGGRVVLLLAVGLWLLGILWTRRLVATE
jgi:tight adherence protein B